MKLSSLRALARLAGGAALCMGLLSACGGGGGSTPPVVIVEPPPAVNAAPQANFTLSGMVLGGGAGADAAISAGSDMTLSAAGSKDPEGDVLSYKWTLTSKPAGSNTVLANASALELVVRPDVSGMYVFTLRVTDSKGAYAEKTITVEGRNNTAPLASVVVTPAYSGVTTTKAPQSYNVGTALVLDAAASVDAEGDAITTTWTLLEKPASSAATLAASASTNRLLLDVAGVYKVRARGSDPIGAYSDIIYTFQADNSAPQTVVLASGENQVETAIGYIVALNGAATVVPGGDALTYSWTLASKPAGSGAALSSAAGVATQVSPDKMGDYVVKLTVSDSKGNSNSFTTTITTRNNRPVANIVTSSASAPLGIGPATRLPLNTQLTLSGAHSVDADGDSVSYGWTLAAKPAGSKAVLSAASGASVSTTFDLSGVYTVALKATDSKGAYSEQLLTLQVGNYAPVAVIDKASLTTLTGAAAKATAAFSYDEDGEQLSYAWSISARPAGSLAAIANPGTAALSFTPDAAGLYIASVTVSDGKSSSIAYVQMRALASIPTALALDFVPDIVRQSKGLDKLVMTERGGKTLRVLDPYTGLRTAVVLPALVKAMQVSANGKLAAVLYEGAVSLVNLETAAIIHTFASLGSQTEALVTNAGQIYLVGHNGGQWVNPEVWGFNGYTGANLNVDIPYGNGTFYGTQHGTFSESRHRAYTLSEGLSPAKVTYFDIDGASGKVTKAADSPYHGTYDMSSPLFLSDDSGLLFSSRGNYFSGDTLLYAGKLTVTGPILSMSHSVAAQEALVVVQAGDYWSGTLSYEPYYQRFTGALLFPDSDLPLPLINGEQSYGMHIFHSGSGSHVALVQTGSKLQYFAGAKYFIIVR
jgi:hypothetical protein